MADPAGPRRSRRHLWRVRLPTFSCASPCPTSNGRLLYGVLLCNARAMGEFGAFRGVGHIAGQTDTMPLHVEALYNHYQYVGALAVASLLALLALRVT